MSMAGKRKSTAQSEDVQLKKPKEEISFDLGDERKISVNLFNGRMLVNIREFYEDPTGKLLPGKKGIALSPGQWEQLKKHANAVQAALVSGCEEPGLALGDNRKVSVTTFKGSKLVNIREYYKDKNTGEEKPGFKGIALSVNQWDKLVEQLTEIDRAVEADGDSNSQPSLAPAVLAAPKPVDGSMSMSIKDSLPISTLAMPPVTEHVDSTIELGNQRKITVNMFKGQMLVNIREFYEDPAGNLLPGKKGIALTPGQWKQLKEHSNDVQAVLLSKQESSWNLGDKRKISVASFKGTRFVNIREYYDDKSTGEEKPGSKGIALSTDQWHRLVEQLNIIDSLVKCSD